MCRSCFCEQMFACWACLMKGSTARTSFMNYFVVTSQRPEGRIIKVKTIFPFICGATVDTALFCVSSVWSAEAPQTCCSNLQVRRKSTRRDGLFQTVEKLRGAPRLDITNIFNGTIKGNFIIIGPALKPRDHSSLILLTFLFWFKPLNLQLLIFSPFGTAETLIKHHKFLPNNRFWAWLQFSLPFPPVSLAAINEFFCLVWSLTELFTLNIWQHWLRNKRSKLACLTAKLRAERS